MSTTDTIPRRIGDVMRPTTEPSPEDAAMIAGVHELAAAFAGLPTEKRPGFLVEVRKLSTGFDRFRATVFTPPDDPMFGPLMVMLDGLNASAGVIQTKHGAFTTDDLREAGAMTVGADRIRFPVGYGTNGTPVFRSQDFSGPTVHPFRVIQGGQDKRPSSMWGDDE